MSNVIYDREANISTLVRLLDEADYDDYTYYGPTGDRNTIERVELSGGFLTIFDDGDGECTFIEADIDNLIEALQALKKEARL